MTKGVAVRVAADSAQVSASLLAVAELLAAMVRDLPDTNIPIPGSEWTVGEQAAHLAYTNVGLAIMARGLFIPYADGTREGFREANADSLDGYPDRDGALLAGRIVEGARAFVAEAAAQPPGEMYQTPMGTMDLDTFRAYVLTHNLMHGCAMADGLGLPSPFEPRHAALVWPFLAHALPLMLHEDAGLEGTIELTVEGCFSAALVLGGGTARVEDAAPGQVDCHLSADPLTFFRVILRMQAVDDAVRRGTLRLTGPRPELGAQLPDHLEVP